MKKLKLLLAFTAIALIMLLACSCMGTGTAQTCAIHRDLAGDGLCDVCGASVPVPCYECLDYDHDGRCDSCGDLLDVVHEDKNHDGICDLEDCGKALNTAHKDTNHDGICDTKTCKKPVLPIIHYDLDKNGRCDVCKTYITENTGCVDSGKDGYCDLCYLPLGTHECSDADGNELCDACGKKIESSDACDCKDGNYDGKCDECGETMQGVIQLFENGKSNYQIVITASATGGQAMLVDRLIAEVAKLGITFNKVAESSTNATEYEIIFGVPSTRGDEYKLDPHVYGTKGYGVEIIGNKILVLSGSESSFSAAIDAFKEEILGITSTTKKLTTRYISQANAISEIQDDYDVKLINLDGTDIKGFTIAADKSDTTTYSTAKALQELLYNRTGYWLDIVPLADADKSIIIGMQAKDYANEGFYATFGNNRISFISEYPTVVNTKVIGFFTTKLSAAKETGVMDITSADSFVDDVRYVYYQDYGAVGDGETDDSEAIRAAHEYANLGGHIIKATKNDNGNGKTYYIGKLAKAIPIKSDVDWGKAKFYLDDFIIKPSDAERSVHIFSIPTTSSVITPQAWRDMIKELNAAGGIDASQFTSFGVGVGKPVLLTVNNSNHKNYIRYGVNASSGSSQSELILIDAEGNIDPTTPFMHDFEYITGIDVRAVDDTPITIQGGSFETSPYIADTPQGDYTYARGIVCNRSNTTFINVRHFLVNEGEYKSNNHANSTDYGCPYGGFFISHYANNVVYENCQVAAHIAYTGSNGAGMGTYDIDPGYSTNVIYKNCYQEDDNFFDASGQTRWGVMGSSYCKNVTFQDCRLTRFDAHNGIHNAFIINTEIKMIRLNGTGTFLMENCIMHSNSLVGLREDYGGFWDGNIILKNNKMVTSSSNITLLTNTWYNHYFGYPARYPTNIIIDGLTVYKSKADLASDTPVEKPSVTLFGSGILTGAKKMAQDYLPVLNSGLQTYYSDGTPVVVANKGQATPPERIVFRNMAHCNIAAPEKSEYTWFEHTEFAMNETTTCTEHFDLFPDGKCDDCGADFVPCTEHVDRNNDGKCCYCATEMQIVCDKHIDKELNGKCDVCDAYYVCDAHIDADGNRICDKCGGVLGCKDAHIDAGEKPDGYCDVCTKLIPTCTKGCVDEVNNVYSKYNLDRYAKPDCKCDNCDADMVATIEPCGSCTDTNGDGLCDVCSGVFKENE